MKSKILRGIINGGVLAAVAALGITVYQLGTKPIVENPQEQNSVELQDEGPEEEISVEEETEDAAASGESSENAVTAEPEGDTGTRERTTAAEKNPEEKTANDSQSTLTDNTTEQTVSPGTAAETSAAGIAAQKLDFTENSIMEWPVRGTVLVDYNMNETVYYPTLDQYRVSPAISLQAVEDAPVYAAADGQVLSIEQDPCTGTTVTMELGNGYQAVYGQLKDLSVSEGDTVKEGAVIGNISQPTKYYSVEGPNLYFAVKKDGEPVDPFEYLE